MREVIHIFGASGSGTTTLAARFCAENGFFHMDTDDYFWEQTDPPYTQSRPIGERLRRMREALCAHERVVISGSLAGWGDPLIPKFTLAVRLSTETQTRLDRLRARELEKLGERILPGGDMAEHHAEFLRWAAAYDDGGEDMRSRRMHDVWQKKLRCPLLLLDGTQPPEENIERIRRKMEEKPLRVTLERAREEEEQIGYALVDAGRRFQREQGFTQWTDDYPTLDTIRQDIRNGKGFLLKANGEAAGYLVVDFDGESAYERIEGKWGTDEPYVVTHRMALSPAFRGMGLAAQAFRLVEEMARARGIYAYRVDTHAENRRMQHVLQKFGFVHRGTIWYESGSRMAYDKIIDRA